MGRITLVRFPREQWTTLAPASPDVFNKTVAITGATSGLGLETGKRLSKLSTAIIATARDTSKADLAKVSLCFLRLPGL